MLRVFFHSARALEWPGQGRGDRLPRWPVIGGCGEVLNKFPQIIHVEYVPLDGLLMPHKIESVRRGVFAQQWIIAPKYPPANSTGSFCCVCAFSALAASLPLDDANEGYSGGGLMVWGICLCDLLLINWFVRCPKCYPRAWKRLGGINLLGECWEGESVTSSSPSMVWNWGAICASKLTNQWTGSLSSGLLNRK